ncbi:MAG TPA: efflux RND transporter periplasmic adaptor subunit [Thermoanaerobaculia bacterium]|nr:efflux RND transporter periplasmic adaptor subunit [Thermoanaerobaculia bacterium]
MSKKKSLVAVALIAVLSVVAIVVHRAAFAKETTAYRFATIERGDVESTVSATGTLSAVTTVAVGTQVSGQISELFVDFNDSVKKGQLLARIDPKLQQQAVTDAQASLARARAQYLQAQREHNRNGELLGAGLVARSAFETTDSTLDVARANVTSAQVALDRARQNLEYTNIYAPIDGVVVERNIDLGQTVAASLSAPQLFLIANDLTNMQILANVGEGDIAQIREGQKVKFTVQALPRQKFEGTVKQVRLQSQTNENVVNYTVVVSVANPKKQLLPGMTARVEFQTEAAEDVLKVANAALRFQPEAGAPASSPADAGASRARARTRSVYVLENGTPKAIPVRTGISDGKFTEVRGDELEEGMKVIAGTEQPQAAETQSASPFQQNNNSQQRGPRGGF